MKVNHKRLWRLYRHEGLAVRRKRAAMGRRVVLALAQEVNERWSMDFVGDSLADGRTFRTDLQDELRRRKAILPIIVLTGHGDVQTSVRALKAGAFDFLQKPAPPSVLLERIHAAIDFDHQARAVKTDRAGVSQRLTHLTPREHEVMELVIAGKRSQEIAAALHVSVRTVEGHRRRVFSKAHVSSAAQLVRTVLRAREADPGT